ncbi:MAG: CBS domain-containing protein [Chloroflexota bacterium]
MHLRDMLIRDWMTKDVIGVTPDTPITTAHQIMKKNRIRRLPVLNDDNVLVGIVTIGDVREASPSGATTLSIWELNYLWSQLAVKDVMSHKVLTVHENEPVINAAKIMLESKISGLPVVDENNHVVGIVTESDVFRMLVKSQTGEIEV